MSRRREWGPIRTLAGLLVVTLIQVGSFGTAYVQYEDGTLPGERTSTVPPGWTVSYSVAGGAPATDPTPFLPVEVTVTNRAPGTAPTTTLPADVSPTDLSPPTGPGPIETGGARPRELARTGPGVALPLAIGLALLVAGALVVRATRPRVTITKRTMHGRR